MPVYLFEHPETGEVCEVVQRMKEDHVYADDSGLEWRRVFVVPAAGIDGKINAFSPKEFVEKTKGKGMTAGQLWDVSTEMSQKREKALGKDPLKEKHFKKYSEKRKGMKHPEQRKEGG